MEFGTAGYTMDHVFVLYDRSSNSVWYPREKTLEAVGGARKGSAIPFLDEPAPVALGDWLVSHPGSTVLLPSERDHAMLNRPYLGIRLEDSAGGVVVSGVAEGSPAAEAGVRVGDVVRSLAGHPLEQRRDLRAILAELGPGDTIEVVVLRDGEEITVRPTLSKP